MSFSTHIKSSFFAIATGMGIFFSGGANTSDFLLNILYFPGILPNFLFSLIISSEEILTLGMYELIMSGVFWGFVVYLLSRALYGSIYKGMAKGLIIKFIKWYVILSILGYILAFVGWALLLGFLFRS